MNFDEKYALLNPEQLKAVNTIEGPMLVVAGPGTGKTQTIALRIGKILRDTQVDPQNILCLTFTETAVVAMRQRLLDMIGKEAYAVRIHTFHSFCNEVIKSNQEKFGELGSNSESITDVEKMDLLSSIINELNFDSPLKPFGNPELYIGEISKLLSQLKRESVTLERFKGLIEVDKSFFKDHEQDFIELKSLNFKRLSIDAFTEFLEKLETTHSDHAFVAYIKELIQSHITKEFDSDKDKSKANTALRRQILGIYKKHSDSNNIARLEELVVIYEKYQSSLRQRHLYDYEDMIMFVVEAFKTDEELLKIYQEKFQYILVDEYQDTNNAQNETIKLLGSFFDSPNIFVVGDDDQAIYRFQGASLENIIFFNKLYNEHINVVVLKNNYRSHQHILDASYSLINNNTNLISDHIDGVDKKLSSKVSIDKSDIFVHEFDSQDEENYFIASEVKGLLESGVRAEQIAVLYRDNKDMNDIADALDRKGVDYSLARGQNIFRDNTIQQFIKFVKYIVSPIEDYNLFHILNYDFVGINGLDLIKLLRFAYKNKKQIGDVIYDDVALEELKLESIDTIKEFARNIIDWQQKAHNEDFVVLFNELIRESGLLHYILGHKDKYELLLKVTRLYDEIRQLDANNDDYLAKDFVEHLNLVDEYGLEINIKPISPKADAIQLMTAHSAKGLEFEYVFITKAINKKWGNRSSRDRIKLPLGITTTVSTLESNEEERRLFYVAMTRAKSKIYILYSKVNANDREQSPSQFITETDGKYLKKISHEQKQDVHEDALMLKFANKIQLEISEKGKDYLKEMLKDYQLSVTHIASYKRCPRCFLYNTLLKIPKVKNKSAAYGTAVHDALKSLLVKYNISGELPELGYVLSVYKDKLTKEHLTEKDMADALANGEKVLNEYYNEKKDTFPKDSLLEANFRSHNIVIDGIQIVGKVDRIDRIDKNNVTVVDYKTGNPDYKSKELNQEKFGDYYQQLVFYKLMIERSPLLNLKVNKGVIEFVEKSKKKAAFVAKEFSIPDEDIDKLIEEIKEIYGKIQNLEFEDCDDDKCYTPELHDIPFSI